MTSKKIFSLAREFSLKWANHKHTMLPPALEKTLEEEAPDTIKDFDWRLSELADDEENEFRNPEMLETLAPSDDIYLDPSEEKTMFPSKVEAAARKFCAKYAQLRK